MLKFFTQLEVYTTFISWPDVPVDGNYTESQMFARYYNIIEKDKVIEQMKKFLNKDFKNIRESREKRLEGNKFYEEEVYSFALVLYNESISLAPRDSVEFALAVANRSAVFFHMEKYKECLENIATVLKSEYPLNLRCKILLRQTECFLKLNSYFEAAKALQKAQECYDKLKAKKTEKTKINNQITKVKNKMKLILESDETIKIDDLITLTEPSLKNGQNREFLNASNLVEIKYSKKLGYHVVAKNDIKKGDVLFIEEPYSSVSIINRDDQIFKCSLCSIVSYCSDKCRLEDWDLKHHWTCFGERNEIIMNAQQNLCLAILFDASRDGFKTDIENKAVYGNTENNHPFINKFIYHRNGIDVELLQMYTKYAVWLVIYLQKYTAYFDWLYTYPNRPEGSKKELIEIVGGQIIKYLILINKNFTLIANKSVELDEDKLVTIVQSGVGCGIYTSSGLLNHSCLANTVQSFCGKKRIVRAMQDIKKGYEVTISYLSKKFYNYEDDQERKEELERYSVKCLCAVCTDPNFKMFRTSFLCPRCHGKAYGVTIESFAKCTECSLCFNAIPYYMNDRKIEELMSKLVCFDDFSRMNYIYGLMKKTYHRHSREYILFHCAAAFHYFKIGDIKKSVERAKSSIEVSAIFYGESPEDYSLTAIFCTYILITYCKILKKQNSPYYEENFAECKEMMKLSASILEYMTCNDAIIAFIADFTKYFNSNVVHIGITEPNGLVLEDFV